MPSDSRILPYRSNVPYLSNYCFGKYRHGVPRPAAKPRETASSSAVKTTDRVPAENTRLLVPLYLGVRFVMAKSFARIHRSNLINSGIIPLVFADPADYSTLKLGDKLIIEDAAAQVERGGNYRQK